MSDLLSLLSLGSAGIAAQNTGVSVATNNVANANTDGFSRQRVDLESLRASPLIGGVRSGSPDRFADNLLAGRIRSANGTLAMSRAFADAVLDVEFRVGRAGPAIHEQLGALFNKLGGVAASPTDTNARSAVIAAASDLVEGIRRRASELAQAYDASTTRIRDRIAEANALAQRLGETNLAIARSDDPVLRDERDRIADQLGELVGGAARVDADGQMRYVLDGGGVLVDGQRPASLATTGSTIELVSGAIRRDVTTTIAGGRIGAELAARDGTIARARSELDQLAFDVASTFNATHTANAGLDGVSGRSMFVTPAQVSGAAAALAIDPGLAADPTRLATAAVGSGPGDNRGALAMFQLSDSPLVGAAIDLVSRIGAEGASAVRDVQRDQLVSDHLAGLRDSLAGVDIQEELTNLAKFEHASSAMTRFVSTIDNLLGDLIDRL